MLNDTLNEALKETLKEILKETLKIYDFALRSLNKLNLKSENSKKIYHSVYAL